MITDVRMTSRRRPPLHRFPLPLHKFTRTKRQRWKMSDGNWHSIPKPKNASLNWTKHNIPPWFLLMSILPSKMKSVGWNWHSISIPKTHLSFEQDRTFHLVSYWWSSCRYYNYQYPSQSDLIYVMSQLTGELDYDSQQKAPTTHRGYGWTLIFWRLFFASIALPFWIWHRVGMTFSRDMGWTGGSAILLNIILICPSNVSSLFFLQYFHTFYHDYKQQ